MQRNDIILIDTCVIIQACDRGFWSALHKNFRLETVTRCLIEAQTGRAQRISQPVTDAELRAAFNAVYDVSDIDILEAHESHDIGHLDDGELELWVHALKRDDAWLLSGPDTASMEFGCSVGHADRLVSLEGALNVLGEKKPKLNNNYQNTWLESVKRRQALGLK